MPGKLPMHVGTNLEGECDVYASVLENEDGSHELVVADFDSFCWDREGIESGDYLKERLERCEILNEWLEHHTKEPKEA